MKKLAYSLIGAMLFSLHSCDTLDLVPEDFAAAGSYWKNVEQVGTYMNGLHTYLRSDYSSQLILGELRGGTMRNGTSSINTSLDYSSIIRNDLRTTSTGVSNWNGYYGDILQINHFIEQVENECTFLSDAQRNAYLGQAYGMRAYYYFMLYRTYGGVPLEDDIKVLDGKIDAVSLYMARSSAEDVLNFIKSDINTSEQALSSSTTFDKYYWSKYATLFLKAQIYMWSAKVTTNDDIQTHTATGKADLETAKQALNEIISSNKFSLVDNYADLFDYSKKGNNTEAILSMYFDRNETTHWGGNFVYTPSIIVGSYFDPEGNLMEDVLQLNTSGIVRYEWKEAFIKSFDQTDSRRAATFLEYYAGKENDQLVEFGSSMLKLVGHVADGIRYFDNDIIMMRYAEVLLMMAEVENGLGNPCASYINQVRERAYGENYTTDLAYQEGTYAENELAILKERDKEFAGEGKRWFDVVRMHDADKQPLAFSADASYPAAGETPAAILNKNTETHKLLWPINTGVMTADPLLKQTWGYNAAEGIEEKE